VCCQVLNITSSTLATYKPIGTRSTLILLLLSHRDILQCVARLCWAPYFWYLLWHYQYCR
jgi:hypothetical protein